MTFFGIISKVIIISLFALLCIGQYVEASSSYNFMVSPDYVCGAGPVDVQRSVHNDMRCARICTETSTCTFTHYCAVDDTCAMFSSLARCTFSSTEQCKDGSTPVKASLNSMSHIAAVSAPSTTTPVLSTTAQQVGVLSSTSVISTTSPPTSSTAPPVTSTTTTATTTVPTTVQASTTLEPAEELTWTFGYSFESAEYVMTNSIADMITHVREGAEIRIVVTFDDFPDDALIFTPDGMYTHSGGNDLCAYLYHTMSLATGNGAFLEPPEHWLIAVCGRGLQQQKWSKTHYQNMQAYVYPPFVARWYYRKRSSPLTTAFEALTAGNLPDPANLLVQMNKGYTFHVELNSQYFFTSKSHHFSADLACAQAIWDTSVSTDDGVMDAENLWKIRQVCTSGSVSTLDIPIATTNTSSAISDFTEFQTMKWKVNDYWELVYEHNNAGDPIRGSYAQLEAAFNLGRKIRIKTSNFSGTVSTVYKASGIIYAVVANYFNPADNDTLLSDTNIFRKFFIFSTSGDSCISVLNVNVFDESIAYIDDYAATNEDIAWYADRDYWTAAYSKSVADNQNLLNAVFSGSDVTCMCSMAYFDILVYPDSIMANNVAKTIAASGFQTPMLQETGTPAVLTFLVESSTMVHAFQAVFENEWFQNNAWIKIETDIDTATSAADCTWNIN